MKKRQELEDIKAKEVLGNGEKLIDESEELDNLGEEEVKKIKIPEVREEDKSILADISSSEFVNA